VIARRGAFVQRLALAVALALAACAVAAESVDVASSAPARSGKAHKAPRAAVPAANFLVEWRIQPVAAAASRGDVVISSNSAATGGASGYGAGAVVVGTARAAAPQSLRVANGREGEMRFDQSTTRMVYDMSYSAASSSTSSTDAASAASGASGGGASRARSKSRDRGVEGHEVVVHRVDGMRVTPHWTQGDTLELDIQLTHGAPTAGSGATGADAGATREFSFTSAVQLSFDEWQSVATVGDGGEELQVRVTWR
jgi:hypothetical protein